MNNLFFWIIVLSFLVPMALRMYRRSAQRRSQDPGLPGGYPGQYPGKQNTQPRDGYTQQDYFRGGFQQPWGPGQQVPPLPQPHPGPPYPGQSYPNQPYPGAAYPGQPYPDAAPYEDSPEYLKNPPQTGEQSSWQQPPAQQPPAQQPPAGQSGGPAAPVPPVAPASSAPQGFRARKLAELDQRYSNGELSMENYMAQRAEIMKG